MAKLSKIAIPGRTENSELLFNSHQLARRKQWLSDSQQSNVIETLERERKVQTKPQRGYIFAGIIDTVKATLDDRGEDVGDTGAPWTEDQIRNVLYFQYHVKHGGTWENRATMKRLSTPMTQEETSEFIDSCLHWLATCKWRIFVPDPRPRTSEAKQ